jgi:DNA-binding response OmpR family regulator
MRVPEFFMNEKRLLIVDDEPAFGEFVRQVALTLGYQVKVTTDSQAFQECYPEFQPTTIMLDMVMPDMDGNELLLWLLQQGYSANLVITTGYNPDYASDAKTLAEFNGLRTVTTLVKPFSLARLRALLSGQSYATADPVAQ